MAAHSHPSWQWRTIAKELHTHLATGNASVTFQTGNQGMQEQTEEQPFPWKQRKAEAPSPAALGCHLDLAESHFSSSQPLAGTGGIW